MTKKKILLISLLVVSVAMTIITYPFSMDVVSYAQTYQKIAAVHGEDMPLMTAMRSLDKTPEKIAEWKVIETSSEYQQLKNIDTAASAKTDSYVTRFIVFNVFVVLNAVLLGMLKKLKYCFLTLGALLMVFPFYWMIASSFKTAGEMNLFPPTMVPNSWSNFSNYKEAWETAPFATYFFNSIFVCFCSVAVVMFTTVLAAFAFSRLTFPGRDLIFTLLLSMMMIPFELLVITNSQTIVRLGMKNEIASLVVPFISSIFYTYILRNFFMSVPESLYNAATVDGCSNWGYLWKVMFPMAKPSIVTIILLNAMASWNSFMWPQLVISEPSKRTLPWALICFQTEAGAKDNVLMMAATLVVLPMLIMFLCARKQIVSGVSRGGIKG